MFTSVICSFLLITDGVLLILNDLCMSNNNLYEKGFSDYLEYSKPTWF